MKLAEALLERKNLKTKVDSLRARAFQNALVQEGDAPAEEPTALLREMDEAARQLGVLIQRINTTNNVTRLPDGVTVSEAIVNRDVLDLRRLGLDTVLNKAAVRQDRIARAEIKFVPAVNIAELRREVDALAQARRELDAQIQAVNWTADLIEEN
jgi:hypothetical protein